MDFRRAATKHRLSSIGHALPQGIKQDIAVPSEFLKKNAPPKGVALAPKVHITHTPLAASAQTGLRAVGAVPIGADNGTEFRIWRAGI